MNIAMMIKAAKDAARAALEKQNGLLAKADAEKRDLTAEETAEFDALTKSIDDETARAARLKVQADRATALDAIEVPAEKSADRDDVTGNLDPLTKGKARSQIPAEPARKLTGVERVGIAVWAAARNKHYPTRTPIQHLADFGLQKIADEFAEHKAIVSKSILSTTVGGGDNVIDTPLSTDFIEFLGNESAFLRGNPVRVDLSMGSLKIPGGNGRTAGSYTAEGASLPYSQATTRAVDMSAKHLKAATAIGNYLIEISPLNVASIFGDELASSMAIGMDAAGLRGDGTGQNPAGILTLVNAAHKFAATATSTTPTAVQIDADARIMLAKRRATNISRRRPAWIMSNRVFTYLQFMQTANGTWQYPGLQNSNPTWHDNTPVIVSEQVPSTLGVGTNESELYLSDFGHILMGEARSLRLNASTEASYKNAGGTLVSAFDLDETVIRAMMAHDFDMRHDKSCVVLTTVKWGG